MIARQEDPTLDGSRYYDRRVRTKPVRLSKRTSDDDTEVRAVNGSIVLQALDPHERLGRQSIHVVLRQQHDDGVVLARGSVKVRESNGTLALRQRHVWATYLAGNRLQSTHCIGRHRAWLERLRTLQRLCSSSIGQSSAIVSHVPPQH